MKMIGKERRKRKRMCSLFELGFRFNDRAQNMSSLPLLSGMSWISIFGAYPVPLTSKPAPSTAFVSSNRLIALSS